MTALPSRLVQLVVEAERRVVRAPLLAADRYVVVPRLGTGSPVHRLLRQTIGALDDLGAALVEQTTRPAAAPSWDTPPRTTSSQSGPARTAPSQTTPARTTPARTTPSRDTPSGGDASQGAAAPAAATPGKSITPATPAPRDEPPAPAAPALLDDEDERRIATLTEELLEAERTEHFVGELADEEIRRAQAEVRAKQIVEDERAEEERDAD